MPVEEEKDPKPPTYTADTPEESTAWSPYSLQRGHAYYRAHQGDGDAATPEELAQITRALFKDDDPHFDRLRKIQAYLHDLPTAPPWDAGVVKGFNDVIQEQIGGVIGGSAPKVGHAQMVQLWHLLYKQEDVHLLRPWGTPANEEGFAALVW